MAKQIMAESSVTQKYQATIPLKVREQLEINAGDKITFEQQDDNTIVVRKKIVNPIDGEYLSALEMTLSEWDSAEDDKAYESL
jgi:antitoxin PrlF